MARGRQDYARTVEEAQKGRGRIPNVQSILAMHDTAGEWQPWPARDVLTQEEAIPGVEYAFTPKHTTCVLFRFPGGRGVVIHKK